MIKDFAVVTERVSHYYADNTSGDDANNGRTLATAKKTLAGVQAILPDIIKHNSSLHLSGVFSEQALILNQYITAGCYFIVDGGSAVDVVAGPFAISNSATTYVTTAAPGWTVDQYVGYWIKIIGGAADGQLRHIHSNTTDTAYQNYPWSVAPEVGVAQFSIVRPATTLTGTSADVIINVATEGAGDLVLQRLRIGGTRGRIYITGQKVVAAHLFLDTSRSNSFYITDAGYITLYPWLQNPDTFGWYTQSQSYVGVCKVASSGSALLAYATGQLDLLGCCFENAAIYGSGLRRFGRSSRFKSVAFYDCQSQFFEGQIFGDREAANCPNTLVKGATGVGLLLSNSLVGVAINTEINDCGSHAIEALKSYVPMKWGVVAGTGNTGAGLYAHGGSSIQIKSGAIPTITGTVGNVATASPTEQEATWAEIEAAGGLVTAAAGATTIEIV